MRKRFAALIILALTFLGFAVPAQAASGQQWYCNSDASYKSIRVGATTIKPDSCKAVSKNAIVHLNAPAYRVQYNSGTWSSCRNNDNFDAANSPSRIGFAVYQDEDCVLFGI